MDIKELFKKVLEESNGVPLIYVIQVFNNVMEAISSGECFYKQEDFIE